MDHEGVFWYFLANLNCRISRPCGGFAPRPQAELCPGPARDSKCPRPPAEGSNDCWSLHVVPPAQHSYPI